jgi:hypothetical protein
LLWKCGTKNRDGNPWKRPALQSNNMNNNNIFSNYAWSSNSYPNCSCTKNFAVFSYQINLLLLTLGRKKSSRFLLQWHKEHCLDVLSCFVPKLFHCSPMLFTRRKYL